MLSRINKRKIKYIKYLNMENITLYLNKKHFLSVLFFYSSLFISNIILLFLCIFFKSYLLLLLCSLFFFLPTIFIFIIGIIDCIKNESIRSYFQKNRKEIEKILQETNTGINYGMYSLEELVDEIIKIK